MKGMTGFDLIAIMDVRIKELQYSKKAIAEDIGVSYNTILHWFRHECKMPLDYALIILRYLDLDIELVEADCDI